MGAVHVEKGDYSKALNCFLLAKQIENEILPASQIGHGYTHKNIGGTYFKLSKYDEALIHFHKALKIQTRTLSDQHPCLIELNESIAITYLKLKNYEQALSYFKNTLNMARNSSSTNVSFIAKTYKNIGDTYTAQKEYEKSVEPYNQALTLHNSVVQDEWSRAVLYTSMGMTLWILGKFEDSLDNMEKVFDSLGDCRKDLLGHEVIGNIFLIIDAEYESSVVADFQQLPNVKVVGRYGQSSLENETVTDNYDDLCSRLTHDLIAHYNRLGTDCSNKHDAKTAKDMFMKAHKLCNIDSEF
ncbi:unnamed protein product [Rotaria sp. Silwood2]|nr:unnamed protein product [Rotaria sp. Silwood2]